MNAVSSTNSNSVHMLQNVPYDQYSANEVGASQFQGECGPSGL